MADTEKGPNARVGSSANSIPALAFLLDVDNTLLDNDRLKEDLAARLEEAIGEAEAERFWKIYEEVREQRQYVDYPETVRRLVRAFHDEELGRRVDSLIETFPYRSYLYPHVFETIDYLKTLGTVVILSDGDAVFQPRKIELSGLREAVGGNVLISIHKEQELPKVFERFPARHYVAVDDKPRIIAALEQECPTRFTTVLVLQGKYAAEGIDSPGPDIVIEQVADLRQFTAQQFVAASSHAAAC